MTAAEAIGEGSASAIAFSCPLCQGSSWVKLPDPGRWIGQEVFAGLQGQIGLVRCRQCGLVFTNPRPSDERLSAFYSGDTYCCHTADGSSSAGAKADFILDLVAKYVPAAPPPTVLDYGAGGGGFLCRARERDWRTRGFEPGTRGLQTCRQAGLDVTDRVDELPIAAFDVVTLNHVFEHLQDPQQVLRAIAPLLKPDGVLFIEVPNARSLRARVALPALSKRFAIDERYRAFPIHLMYYASRTLAGVLERSHWTVELLSTSGMGIEEYFIRTPASTPPAEGKQTAKSPNALPKRRLRHVIRDAFLRTGWGENLIAVARPPR